MMTVVELRDDALGKLGIVYADASADVLQDVLQAINWGQQMLWRSGTEYFTRQRIPVTLIEGTGTYTMEDSVQSLIGPVISAAGVPLRRIDTRGEMEEFGLIYLGQTVRTLSNAAPIAYFVDDLRQTGDDVHDIILSIVPTPDSGAVTNHSPVIVDGTLEPTVYVTADLSSTDAVQVADGYVESLLLPLVRLAITRSSYFSREELEVRIQADADQAMAILGIADPEKPLKREAKR